MFTYFFTQSLQGNQTRQLSFFELDNEVAIAVGTEAGLQDRADVRNRLALTYPNGARADLSCGFLEDGPLNTVVTGERGTITVDSPIWRLGGFTLALRGKEAERWDFSVCGNGLPHEVAEVHECLYGGRGESPKMPLVDSLEILKLINKLYRDWGIQYPSDPRR